MEPVDLRRLVDEKNSEELVRSERHPQVCLELVRTAQGGVRLGLEDDAAAIQTRIGQLRFPPHSEAPARPHTFHRI